MTLFQRQLCIRYRELLLYLNILLSIKMIQIMNMTRMNICDRKYSNIRIFIKPWYKDKLKVKYKENTKTKLRIYHFYLYLYEYHQVQTRVSNNKFVNKYRPKISREAGFHTDWRNIWQDFFRCSSHNSNAHKQLINERNL